MTRETSVSAGVALEGGEENTRSPARADGYVGSAGMTVHFKRRVMLIAWREPGSLHALRAVADRQSRSVQAGIRLR